MILPRSISLVIALSTGLGSCAFFEPNTAVLWTNRPEFAIYVAYFNASQDKYTVETRYFESPAQKLTDTREGPDIVIGDWLKSISTRTLFRSLDPLFKQELLSSTAFYPRLLALGNIDGTQYLLPVAFNIPAIVFAQSNGGMLSDPFTIGLEEIKTLGKAYNIENKGVYSRMGFSPAWNDAFLFITATLFNTAFKEAPVQESIPISWDAVALEHAMTYISSWIAEANTGIQAEDDFVFKYCYDPPAKLAMSGRILFTYMNSAEFFTLDQEQKANLDFRWIAENDTIPLSEDTVYYGISKKGKAKAASIAFTTWFFKLETQRLLLEISKNYRINENLFGIGNGFSSLRIVTEQVFPQFYPSLLGHMPPEAFLAPPNILPRNWIALKERVILSYLHDRIRYTGQDALRPLERRVSDWYRLNKGL
ncbi:MAG: hypothetical protein LBU17_04305 [Treponema sp.]|jgi:ABC-type glycerol-3-phosphate transport system substrate-binding protein|nr:hypothetical protein [Treponema sp.]